MNSGQMLISPAQVGSAAGITTVDVSTFPGDFGQKLQAAHDALPSGNGVLDCRRLTGAQQISSKVAISKKVEIILGTCTITCLVNEAFDFQFSGAAGSRMHGTGRGTVVQAAGGVTPIINITAYEIELEDFQISYTSGDPTNIGIKCFRDPFVVRYRFKNLFVIGFGKTGRGIEITSGLLGMLYGLQVSGWGTGIYQTSFAGSLGLVNSNVNPIYGSTIELNGIGMEVVDASWNGAYGCTFQNNDTAGLRLSGTSQGFFSDGNFYENPLGVDVDIVGGTNHRFCGDRFAIWGPTSGFGLNVIIGAAVTGAMTFVECHFSSGVTNNSAHEAVYTVSRLTNAFLGELGTGPHLHLFAESSGYGADYNTITGVVSVQLQLNEWQTVNVTRAMANVTATALTVAPDINVTANGTRFYVAQALSVNDLDVAAGITESGYAMALRLDATRSRATDVGTLVSLYGSRFQVGHLPTVGAGATTTNGYGLMLEAFAGAGTIGTLTMVYIKLGASGGAITSAYGLRIDDFMVGATNYYAIYTQAGRIEFNALQTAIGDFTVYSQTDTKNLWSDASLDAVGIGRSFLDNTKLGVQRTWVNETGNKYGIEIVMTHAPAGPATSLNAALQVDFDTNQDNAQTFTDHWGVYITHRWSGTASVTRSQAIRSFVLNERAGTVTNGQAVYARVWNTGLGVIVNAYSLYAEAPDNSGGGSITNYTGVFSGMPTSGTFTSVYGVYVSDPGGGVTATNLFAYYSHGGNVFFNGGGGNWYFRVGGANDTVALYVQGSTDRVGIGTNAPATKLEVQQQIALTVGLADAYAAALTFDGSYTGAFVVTRHNYMDLLNPGLAGGATITDACVFRYNANPGTHKALDAGTTKTTPGTVDAWRKENVNGVVYYGPLYTSKTT